MVSHRRRSSFLESVTEVLGQKHPQHLIREEILHSPVVDLVPVDTFAEKMVLLLPVADRHCTVHKKIKRRKDVKKKFQEIKRKKSFKK